jgi:hypothetical protein
MSSQNEKPSGFEPKGKEPDINSEYDLMRIAGGAVTFVAAYTSNSLIVPSLMVAGFSLINAKMEWDRIRKEAGK